MNDHVADPFRTIIDTIRPAPRRQPGISDEQQEREHSVSARLLRAIMEMELAMDAVNELSAVVKIDTQPFQDFVHDEIPSRLSWVEKISEARRGY